jgi:hypothetical protein
MTDKVNCLVFRSCSLGYASIFIATRELSQGRVQLGGERVDQLSTDDAETLDAGNGSWLLVNSGRRPFSADVSQQAPFEQNS